MHHQIKLGVEVLVATPALVVRRRVDLLAMLSHSLPGLEDCRTEVTSKDAVGFAFGVVEAIEQVNVELLLTVERLAALGALPIGQRDVTPTTVSTNGARLFGQTDLARVRPVDQVSVLPSDVQVDLRQLLVVLETHLARVPVVLFSDDEVCELFSWRPVHDTSMLNQIVSFGECGITEQANALQHVPVVGLDVLVHDRERLELFLAVAASVRLGTGWIYC